MADRNLDAGRNVGKGLVYIDLSWLANNVSDPLAATFRGSPLLDHIQSVTYVATGKYQVVFKNKYRYIVTKFTDMEEGAVPDGSYATIGNVAGEGGGVLSLTISLFTAGGVATAFTGRRVSLSVVLKNSTVGV